MYGIIYYNYSLLRLWSSQTKYLNRNGIKNIFISSKKKKKKKQKSKQFNLYEKLTKTKFNFDSNPIFYKLWFYIYIYIYIYIYYLGLFILPNFDSNQENYLI